MEIRSRFAIVEIEARDRNVSRSIRVIKCRSRVKVESARNPCTFRPCSETLHRERNERVKKQNRDACRPRNVDTRSVKKKKSHSSSDSFTVSIQPRTFLRAFTIHANDAARRRGGFDATTNRITYHRMLLVFADSRWLSTRFFSRHFAAVLTVYVKYNALLLAQSCWIVSLTIRSCRRISDFLEFQTERMLTRC